MLIALALACAHAPATPATELPVAPPTLAPIAEPPAAPAASPLAGCVQTEDPALGLILACPRGKVVLRPLVAGAREDEAVDAVLPQLDDVTRLPFDLRFATEIRGSSLQGLMLHVPSGGAAWFIYDPRSPQGQAAACLDKTPGAELDAWCRVAVESVWGPRPTGTAAP